MKRLEKKEKKKLCTTKKIIWLCLINGIIWVWCSYALAFIGMLKEDYTGASIAESLSSAAVTEIIGVVLVYCLKSLIEKRQDFSSFTNDKNIGTVSIECECEPYKYKTAKTVITKTVSGEDIIALTNLRKRVVPEITIEADSALHIVYDTYNVWDLGSGSYTLPELELKAGENSVSVTGTGNITFSYQEAGL